jgi:hypothetical protein
VVNVFIIRTCGAGLIGGQVVAEAALVGGKATLPGELAEDIAL